MDVVRDESGRIVDPAAILRLKDDLWACVARHAEAVPPAGVCAALNVLALSVQEAFNASGEQDEARRMPEHWKFTAEQLRAGVI